MFKSTSVTAEVAGSSPVVPAINQSESEVCERDFFFHTSSEGAEGFARCELTSIPPAYESETRIGSVEA